MVQSTVLDPTGRELLSRSDSHVAPEAKTRQAQPQLRTRASISSPFDRSLFLPHKADDRQHQKPVSTSTPLSASGSPTVMLSNLAVQPIRPAATPHATTSYSLVVKKS